MIDSWLTLAQPLINSQLRVNWLICTNRKLFNSKPTLNLLSIKCRLGNSRKYPYPTTDGFHVSTSPCLRKFQNALPPPCPQNSIIVNPPSPSEFPFFLEVNFRLNSAYINKWTWIDSSSRLWSSGARWQALLFSDKKNLPLVARLCKLISKSEFGYKNEHHLW